MHPKRKTIGLRVPDNNIAQALLSSLGEPLMSTSLILADDLYNCYAFICLAKDYGLDIIVPDKKNRNF